MINHFISEARSNKLESHYLFNNQLVWETHFIEFERTRILKRPKTFTNTQQNKHTTRDDVEIYHPLLETKPVAHLNLPGC